jgi:hypothetical protein
LFNLLMLPANGFFLRSRALSRLDPETWSPFGQLSVLLWAGAYWAAARDGAAAGSLVWLVFAVEKAVYVAQWTRWMATHDPVKVLKASFKSDNKHDVVQARECRPTPLPRGGI